MKNRKLMLGVVICCVLLALIAGSQSSAFAAGESRRSIDDWYKDKMDSINDYYVFSIAENYDDEETRTLLEAERDVALANLLNEYSAMVALAEPDPEPEPEPEPQPAAPAEKTNAFRYAEYSRESWGSSSDSYDSSWAAVDSTVYDWDSWNSSASAAAQKEEEKYYVQRTMEGGVVVSQGSMGSGVRNLQEKLIELGYLEGEADGVFGDNTRRALRAFQEDNGFTADGILRRDAWAYLNPEEGNMEEFVEEYEKEELTEESPEKVEEAESTEENEVTEKPEENAVVDEAENGAGQELLREKARREQKKNALVFLRRSVSEDAVAYGIVDFNERFIRVQEDFVLVPIHVRDLEVGQRVKAVLSNGSEFELTCFKEETVLVPFPKNANGIGYVVYLL